MAKRSMIKCAAGLNIFKVENIYDSVQANYFWFGELLKYVFNDEHKYGSICGVPNSWWLISLTEEEKVARLQQIQTIMFPKND